MIGTKQHSAAKKSFGQHFLHDAAIIQKILAAVDFDSAKKIVEIGPGRGALTVPLYEKLVQEGRGEDLMLIEIDADLLPDLRDRFPQATLVHADATEIHWQDLLKGEPWLLVSNLPYNVGTAIVNDVFWCAHPPVSAVVMLQKEIGDRILAHPPGMSVLSVAMQLKTEGKRICTVKPGAFTPPPKVDSVVLKLTAEQKYPQDRAERIIALAKKGFAHPRRQLRQTLAQAGAGKREEIGDLLAAQGLSPLARPEEVSLEVWSVLEKSLKLEVKSLK